MTTTRAGDGTAGGPDAIALARVHADAVAFYRAQLHRAEPGAAAARALLTARQVPPAAVTGFELGYAPAGWTGLTWHLRALGHPDHLLLAAGVSLRSRHGALLDRFRHRLMFPVHSPSGGDVLGLLGRLVPDPSPDPSSGLPTRGARRAGVGPGAVAGSGAPGEPAPKYLNSPHTTAYRKGEVLYGLGAPAVRQALAAGALPVLVEGPLDAIAVTASQPGRYVGVAPCGTALTPAQVGVLQAHAGPLADRGVVTAFDADPAGRQAGVRAFELLRATGAWPTAAALPPGTDPADLAVCAGPAALAQALHAPGPLADLVVDAHLQPWAGRLHWAEGRVEAARAAAQLLAGFPPDQVGRQVQRIAGRLGLEHSQLTAALLEAVSPTKGSPTQGSPTQGSPTQGSPTQGSPTQGSRTPVRPLAVTQPAPVRPHPAPAQAGRVPPAPGTPTATPPSPVSPPAPAPASPPAPAPAPGDAARRARASYPTDLRRPPARDTAARDTAARWTPPPRAGPPGARVSTTSPRTPPPPAPPTDRARHP